MATSGSTNGYVMLMGFEAIVASRYKDSVGVWTIGVGHTRMAGAPDPALVTRTLTLAEVVGMFQRDVRKYEGYVRAYVPHTLTQWEFDALLSFCYNLGPGNLQKLVKGRTKSQIGAAITLYALPSRRRQEQVLFQTGRYPRDNVVLYKATPNGTVLWSTGQKVNVRQYFSAEPAPTPAPTVPAGAAAGGAVVAGGVAAAVSTGSWIPLAITVVVVAAVIGFVIWQKSRASDKKSKGHTKQPKKEHKKDETGSAHSGEKQPPSASPSEAPSSPSPSTSTSLPPPSDGSSSGSPSP